MPVKLYLFDMSKEILEANLKVVGLSIETLIADFGAPGFEPERGPSNNPWQGLNRDGKAMAQSAHAGLGYGVPLVARTERDARALIERFRRLARTRGRPDIARIIGIDLVGSSMSTDGQGQHWCAGTGQGRHFGTRRQANRLIRAEALRDTELTGEGVRVFVVDQGLDQDYISHLGGRFGGGLIWTPGAKTQVPGKASDPYSAPPNGHGSMLARSLIDLAPDATLYDLPLLPNRITEVENFALRALFAFAFMNYFVLSAKGPWVILNAWGIVDRFAESLRGFYTDDPDHYLNSFIASIGRRHDVIFAAGNSGQFCGDPRSTGYDRGPGRSIWGANGLPDVTCVGAVRSDAQWVGAASQGPGPSGFDLGNGRPEKPDLCAPSWFVEDANAHLRSGGTSSSSAVVAGAVAALRQKWGTLDIPPAQLRQILRDGARETGLTGWRPRTGNGALDLAGTIAQLP